METLISAINQLAKLFNVLIQKLSKPTTWKVTKALKKVRESIDHMRKTGRPKK